MRTATLFPILLSCFLISFDLPDAVAKVLTKEKVVYYTIKGNTGRELFRSMLKKGPKIGRRSDHALATTEFEFDVVDLKGELRGNRCVVSDVTLKVAVKYTYPKWNGSSKASSATRKAWKNFINAVVWHEKQHKNIALGLAKDYEKILRKTKFKYKGGCSDKALGLNIRISGANLRSNNRHRRFDRRDLKRGGRAYKAQYDLIQAE